jgi:hypothetical protein
LGLRFLPPREEKIGLQWKVNFKFLETAWANNFNHRIYAERRLVDAVANVRYVTDGQILQENLQLTLVGQVVDIIEQTGRSVNQSIISRGVTESLDSAITVICDFLLIPTS